MKKVAIILPLLLSFCALVYGQTKPKIEWASIPAGTFIMGSPLDEQENFNESDEIIFEEETEEEEDSTFYLSEEEDYAEDENLNESDEIIFEEEIEEEDSTFYLSEEEDYAEDENLNESDEIIFEEKTEEEDSTFYLSDEQEFNINETQRQVTLSAFKMSKHEVTFEQYDAFCAATDREKPYDEGWGRGKRPVINVSWDDASAFAKWVGARLPTEAEWEYVCRAGTITPYNTGNNLTTNQGNYNGNYPYNNNAIGIYREMTTEVGAFSPNAWGLYDLHGNVWEWCLDWNGDYLSSSQLNPKGPTEGSFRVLRGGSFSSAASICRSASRSGNSPDFRGNEHGFRLVSPE